MQFLSIIKQMCEKNCTINDTSMEFSMDMKNTLRKIFGYRDISAGLIFSNMHLTDATDVAFCAPKRKKLNIIHNRNRFYGLTIIKTC